ncbi:KamA family radical SAM protein [Candidatus Hydrogenedentota bacterium]
MSYNNSTGPRQEESWEKKLAESICDIHELAEVVSYDPADMAALEELAKLHPMRITRHYLSLIDRDDVNDPIRTLMLPSLGEQDLSGSFDTSGEGENTKLTGLQHKYDQTALILATNQCAAYCRFCFRKRLVGVDNEEILSLFGDAVEYVREHDEINNVLISGGDPFVLPTDIIEEFLKRLSPIPHLRFIRFGSRIPVVFPDRILDDPSLPAVLGKYSRNDRRIYVTTHFNHPREICEKSVESVDQLLKAGVTLHNQTVLLNGVNDDPEVLADLQNRLAGIGVSPYYVFQCRPVKRVRGYFQVPFKRGYRIVEEAKTRLNGYSKRFRFMMSHRTGKIEIVAVDGDKIHFKYHQAKDPSNAGRFFTRNLNETAGWLDDLD